MNRVDTDVLVIGSGGAGLRAAIAAHEVGVDVLLVSKMPLGRNNCTEFAGGYFYFAGSGVSKEEHLERTLRTGKRLNEPNLVRILCEEAPQEVRHLTEFGVRLDFDRPHGASTAPYSPPLRGGAELTRSLVKYVLKQGIKTQEWVMIQTLLKNQDNQVTGALGLQTKTGELIHYQAKAVVLATGGLGELFTLNDNPIGMTGDGYTLAYNAGADLIDMEFVQFYPLGIAEPGYNKWFLSLEILDICPVVNREGKEFLREKMEELGIQNGVEANLVFRDLGSIVIALEIFEGRGENNAVLLDLPQVPEHEWEEGYMQFVRTKLLRRFDFQQHPLHVAPIYHFMIGGVRINEHGATTIPGLYAAGEVTGGVHGANRHGGNALSEIIVWGRHAGEAAGLYTKDQPLREQDIVALEQIQETLKNLVAEKEPKISPRELKTQIRQLNDKYLHVVRTETGLKALINSLEQLNTSKLHTKTPKETIQAFEALNLITVSKLIATAALSRQESRGTHYRHDYPYENDAWLRHTVIRKRNQALEVVHQNL